MAKQKRQAAIENSVAMASMKRQRVSGIENLWRNSSSAKARACANVAAKGGNGVYQAVISAGAWHQAKPWRKISIEIIEADGVSVIKEDNVRRVISENIETA